MKIYVVAVLLMVACGVSAQFPAGFNYNPFLYFPYSALQPPVQETAEVAAARASHMLAHAARGRRSVVDTPEVWAAKVEHYRAHQVAAAANGAVSSLPPLYYYNHAVPQPVQDTAEVAAAKAEFFRAFNAASARG